MLAELQWKTWLQAVMTWHQNIMVQRYILWCSVFKQEMGDFTFWLRLSLRLSLSLNFGLSTYLSQKVKWFRWTKTWRLTPIV